MSEQQVRTYRGRSLAEVAEKVRRDLGEDALIIRQREGLAGGLGGFFQQRCFEVDAAPPGAAVAEAAAALPPAAPPAAPAEVAPAVAAQPFVEQLEAAQAVAEAALAERRGEGFEEPGEGFEPDTFPHLRSPEEAAALAETAFPEIARENAAALAALFAPDAPRAEPASKVPVAPAAPEAEAEAVFEPEPDPVFEPEPEAVVVPDPEPQPEPAPAPRARLDVRADDDTPAVPRPAPRPEPATTVAESAALPVPAVPKPALPARRPQRPSSAPARATSVWPAEAEPVHEGLVGRGLSRDVAADVLDQAVTHLLPFSSTAQLKPLVAEALARRIPVQALRGPGGRVVGFVGPGGSGKTRSVARLAHAYAERSPVPVACVTLRSKDDGAELRKALAPSGVSVYAYDDAAQARARIEGLRDEAFVLVDTPGVSPRAQAELRVLAAELRQLALDECHLAVPATIAPEVGRDLVKATRRRLGVDALALTHADETDQIGTVVDLAIESELPLSYVGRGTIVSGGLRPAVADELAVALVS